MIDGDRLLNIELIESQVQGHMHNILKWNFYTIVSITIRPRLIQSYSFWDLAKIFLMHKHFNNVIPFINHLGKK